MKYSLLRRRPGMILTLAALLAAGPTLGLADESAPSDRREKMQQGADRMADELGLTSEQRAKMKLLFQQERAELEALRADTSLAKEDRRAKAGEIHRKYKDLRDAILTPEQKAKADKMRENFEKRRGGKDDKPADK